MAAHTAAGALGGGVAGALGAGASAMLMPRIGEAIADMALPAPVAQALGAATAAAIGAMAGGAAGLASAYSVDINNRQLHPKEINWIKDNAKRFAQSAGISEAEAEKRLAQQAFRQVQYGVEGATDPQAKDFLRIAGPQLLPGDPSVPGQTVGYMFTADPVQRANPNMYATAIVSDPKALAFYAANGIVQPTAAAIWAAASKDAAARDTLTGLTIGAAAGALAVAVPPALSWCLSNPVACNRTVMAGGEIAAGDALGPAGLAVLGTTSAVKAVKSADEVNAAMRVRGWEPAWSPGTPVVELALQPGTKVHMIIDAKTAESIKRGDDFTPGGWATFDDVSSISVDMRQRLAITGGFKNVKDGPFYVLEMEITRPVQSNIGFVGSQIDNGGRILRGGGSQVQFDEAIPGHSRLSFMRPTGQPVLLR
ncbi:MAG: hypothetical protein WKG03_07755 [Telluria sp.]